MLTAARSFLAVSLALIAAGPTFAAVAGLERVATGLVLPSFATHAPNDPNRLFVTGLRGDISIIDLTTNSVIGTFLDIEDTDNTGEGGLLGLAFHPDYSSTDPSKPGRGKFYVYVTVDNGRDTSLGVESPFSSHIREYSVDPNNPNVALPASKREILSFVQPHANHNAGWIGFNPATSPNQPQYLYIASGDGGSRFDLDEDGSDTDGTHGGHTPGTGNAQDTTNNPLGKMLRVDIGGDDFPSDPNSNYAIPPTNPFKAGVGDPSDDAGDDEIWSYGLRNPFRNSFDRRTGDLWIADVGQNQREEIDFQSASSSGGENYGWRVREGTVATQIVGGPLQSSFTQPIYDYTRGGANPGPYQGRAVTGGYRYRGPDPDLQGLYFFGDSDVPRVWTLDPPQPVATGGTVSNIGASLGEMYEDLDRIVSFGEDLAGNLYIVDLGMGGDTGELYRIVTDNLIDGDFNADGQVDSADYDTWQKWYGSGDGAVNAADYVLWRKNVGHNVYDFPSAGASAPEPGTLSSIAIAFLLAFAARLPRRTVRL